MASAAPDQLSNPEQEKTPAEGEGVFSTPDKAAPELLAPQGWEKKIASLKEGGTPKRGSVFFVAPDGEEIKTKRALQLYLKSHSGGPPISEFDWSTGETPTRRSSRLSSKTRPSLDSPESGSGGKRRRKKVTEEEEAPQDKDEAGPEAPPAEVPVRVGKDEVMEDVGEKEELKSGEDIIVPSLEENDDHKNAEPVEDRIEKAPEEQPTKLEEAAEVVQVDANVDEQKKPEEMPISVKEKSAAEQGEVTPVDVKVCEDEKSKLNSHDGEVAFPGEHKDQKEVSDKMSSGFPHFSEAQNSSRPVGVSI